MTATPKQPISKFKAALILAAIIVVAWLAYTVYASRYPQWKEDVQLPDGRTITVTQKRDYQGSYGSHQSWLTFELPETKGQVTWNEKLYPVMLGVADGKVYVVGRPRGDNYIRDYRRPKYMYVAFELRNSKFERIAFMALPEPLRIKENVRWCFPGGHDRRILKLRTQPAWCDDLDPKWPTPQIVDLNIRAAEAKDWADAANAKVFSE
jgi:hypothetical protein